MPIPKPIKEAILRYQKAVGNVIVSGHSLIIAEQAYDILNNLDKEGLPSDNQIDNIVQTYVQASTVDMNRQYELMEATKILDVLVELAKLGMIDEQ